MLRIHLEFDIDVGFASLFGADFPVRSRHAVIPHHHVVLDHAEPLRLGVSSGAGRILLALQVFPLIDIGPGAIEPVSSLFQRTNRTERSVCTSGELNTRATSITSAVPDPSSLAASPQPWPSMWPPMMYISSGCVVPIFVQ